MKLDMRIVSVLVLCCTGLAGCAGRSGTAASLSTVPVSDREVGLVRRDVSDTPTPPPVVPDTSEPGQRPPVPPPFAGSPPVIPHGIADFLPITADTNACLDCHAVSEKVAGEPTPIPASHYTDLRHDPGRVGAEVVGARYVCTSCHVAQTAASPLVPNGFESP